MNRYVIIDASEVSSVDFSQVLETSADTLLYNLARTKFVLKFEGDSTPSFLDGVQQYSHEEILSEINGSERLDPNPFE